MRLLISMQYPANAKKRRTEAWRDRRTEGQKDRMMEHWRHEHKDGGLARDEGVTEKKFARGMGQAAVRSWQQRRAYILSLQTSENPCLNTYF